MKNSNLLRFSQRALDTHPRQQLFREAEPGHSPPHPCSGSFPDGNSALILVCAGLRHVAGTQWGNKKSLNMKHLEVALEDASMTG